MTEIDEKTKIDLEKINEKPGGSSRLVINSLGFVIGFGLVFIAMGATVTSLGRFLTNHRTLLEKISGLVMVIFGLNFTGLIKIGFLNSEKRMELKFNKLHFLSAVLFGMIFGLGWTPCLGAFLGSALALASNSETITNGMLLLLVYSLGLGIPFVLSAIVFQKAKGVFKAIRKYNRIISIVSGLLLIAAGMLVFTGMLKYLA
jgi:cytochrome c-type biogenesis protein